MMPANSIKSLNRELIDVLLKEMANRYSGL